MSLIRFKAENHPQQTHVRGPKDLVDDRATDPTLFAHLDKRYGPFTLDVAACSLNAKCDRFYTKDDDGLQHSWRGHSVWCNPPFSSILPWVQKAHAEAAYCPVIVMILPANRTEQKWWQEEGPNERPPFGCCLLIWKAGNRKRLSGWQ